MSRYEWLTLNWSWSIRRSLVARSLWWLRRFQTKIQGLYESYRIIQHKLSSKHYLQHKYLASADHTVREHLGEDSTTSMNKSKYENKRPIILAIYTLHISVADQINHQIKIIHLYGNLFFVTFFRLVLLVYYCIYFPFIFKKI